MSEFKKDLTSGELVDLLFKYTAKIAEERSLDNLLILMNDLGKKLVVCDRCTLWLIDKSKQEVWTKVAHGVDEIRMPIGKGVVGECIRTRQSIIIDNAYIHPTFNKTIDEETGYQTRSIIAEPIYDGDGSVMGVYQAINKLTKEGRFTQADLEHMNLSGTYHGKALESAMLIKEIESTQSDLVFILGEAGESRSKETGNHVKRVAGYCEILARAYGLPEEEVELIRIASPLHDLGKIAIPDSILKKPGKLTFEEFEVMKTHAQIGEDILTGSERPLINAARIIAGEHHEKWNGKGYPRGTVGEDIHLYGRIGAIADVFDALVSDRCYKKAWPLEKVLILFREERGEHFDPNLVDLFFEKLPEFMSIKEKYVDEFEESQTIY
ncbi:MAG: HD domain-containing protein [Fibrobacterales bacterium]